MASQQPLTVYDTNPERGFTVTMGPWFLGSIIGSLLTGMATIQAWTYFQTSKRDHWLLKASVAVSLALAWVNWLGMIDFCWSELIADRTLDTSLAMNILRGSMPPGELIANLVPNLAAAVVQAFLARRAYVLYERNVWIVVLSGLLVAASCVVGIAFTIWLKITVPKLATTAPQKIPALVKQITMFSKVPLWPVAGTDIILSTLLIAKFYKSLGAGFGTTDHLLRRLLLLTVTSALLPTSATLLVAILSNFSDQGIYASYAVPLACLPPLYTCTLSYTLNSRSDLRGEFSSRRTHTSQQSSGQKQTWASDSNRHTWGSQYPHRGTSMHVPRPGEQGYATTPRSPPGTGGSFSSHSGHGHGYAQGQEYMLKQMPPPAPAWYIAEMERQRTEKGDV